MQLKSKFYMGDPHKILVLMKLQYWELNIITISQSSLKSLDTSPTVTILRPRSDVGTQHNALRMLRSLGGIRDQGANNSKTRIQIIMQNYSDITAGRRLSLASTLFSNGGNMHESGYMTKQPQ